MILDPAVNDLIVAYSNQFSGETKIFVVDVIDVIYSAGPQGVTVPEWASRIRQIHPEAADLMTILKGVAQKFIGSGHIRRAEDKRYVWSVPNTASEAPPEADGLDDVSPQMKQAMSQQVSLMYDALGIIRERSEISCSDWAKRLAHRFGMPPPLARNYVDHIIQQFRGIIVPVGTDRWRYQEEAPRQDSMSLFRDIVNNPEPLPDDEI